jgi:hypothetical protein
MAFWKLNEKVNQRVSWKWREEFLIPDAFDYYNGHVIKIQSVFWIGLVVRFANWVFQHHVPWDMDSG